MQRIVLFLLLMIVSGLVPAQNLVPNPSFEELLECPNSENWGNVDTCLAYWTDPTNTTSDCLHVCSSLSYFSVPTQAFSSGIIGGHQIPRTGEGYAAFGARGFHPWNPDEYREYLHNRLTETLIEGQCYYIDFYINRFNNSRYAMNVGLLFTLEEIDLNSGWSGATGPGIMDSPQIEQPQAVLLTDTVNWMRVNGTYLAEGGEEYITIGNFDYNYDIDTITVFSDNLYNWDWAYYLVEDVSVTLIPDNLGPARAGPDQILVSGDTIQIGDNPLSDAVYRWYPAEGLNDTMLENPLAFPEITTTYYCIKQACGWQSIDSVTVTVIPPTGIFGPSIGSSINLSPNPSSGDFRIDLTPGYPQTLYLELVDIRGTRMLRKEIPPDTENLLVSFPQLPGGLYLVTLENRSGQLLYRTKIAVVE